MKISVVYFTRKRVSGNYSIENLFIQVRKMLPADIVPIVKEMRYQNQGFLRRLYILFEAAFNRGDVNHITGDIHFIALLLPTKRTVLTIHDIGFMSNRGLLPRLVLKWFWITLPVRKSAVVTVVSNATKSNVMQFLDARYEGRIKVIYNPIKGHFLPSPKTFNKKEPTVLQIGTKYNKNLPRLIKGLEGVNCRLEIVGKIGEDIRRQLHDSGINYHCSENLSEDEMVEMYKQADIVSFVSTNEGFGLPIVEANATGRVVITANVSSMPEIGGEAAHFVDPFDVASIKQGFLKIIDDDAYREKLILNGYENRKRFDEQTIANQYVGIYKSLLSKA